MLEIVCNPPAGTKSSADVFNQSVRLMEGEEVVAQARWQVTAGAAQGVVQILEFTVSPGRRRKGFGRQLMDAVTRQAKEHLKARKSKLRRVWMTIEQKGQVVARSFLMQFGFNHVGTISEVLKDEDLLIYLRTFN